MLGLQATVLLWNRAVSRSRSYSLSLSRSLRRITLFSILRLGHDAHNDGGHNSSS